MAKLSAATIRKTQKKDMLAQIVTLKGELATVSRARGGRGAGGTMCARDAAARALPHFFLGAAARALVVLLLRTVILYYAAGGCVAARH